MQFHMSLLFQDQHLPFVKVLMNLLNLPYLTFFYIFLRILLLLLEFYLQSLLLLLLLLFPVSGVEIGCIAAQEQREVSAVRTAVKVKSFLFITFIKIILCWSL